MVFATTVQPMLATTVLATTVQPPTVQPLTVQPPTVQPPTVQPILASSTMDSPPPNEQKARHNLTERKRVNRLNGKFDRLQNACDEFVMGEACANSSDYLESLLNPNDISDNAMKHGYQTKSHTKADTLEAAIKVIEELRTQIKEVRGARFLDTVH